MTTINFSGQFQQQTIWSKPKVGLKHGLPPLERPSQLAFGKILKKKQHGICLGRFSHDRTLQSQKLSLIRVSRIDIDFTSNPLSASDTIKHFYACINEKKLKEIDAHISRDCSFEDYSYPYPLLGKKEVMSFFKQLTAGMGDNVKFVIEHVCEDGYTAAVNWHLEWNKTPIPFTRGCSFYECSQEGDKLVITKGWVVTESPIKPGGVTLGLLKNVTVIFDAFPKAAEWLLKKPHVILKLIWEFYIRFLAPIMNPIISGYFRFWNYMARSFAFAFSIIIIFAKKYRGHNQSSSPSRPHNISNNESATIGPRTGGNGGGLLNAAIGPVISLSIILLSIGSSISCFFGVEVATLPHDLAEGYSCLSLCFAGNNAAVPRM